MLYRNTCWSLGSTFLFAAACLCLPTGQPALESRHAASPASRGVISLGQKPPRSFSIHLRQKHQSPLSTGWPQNVLQLDSGSLCSPDAVLFSFHVLHTFDVWLRCYPVQVPPASASVLARSPRSVCKVNSWADVASREGENNFCGLTIVLQLQDRQLPDQEHRGRLGRKDRAFVLKTSVLRDSAQILATLHDVTVELRPNFLN